MRSNSACSTGTDFSSAGAAEPKKPRLKECSVPYSESPNIGYNYTASAGKDGLGTMRAIGLVLLSIAIMALLLTDADAQRRSSAQGSQAAGAKGSWCATYPSQGLNDNCSYSSFNQCYQTAVLGRGGFCRPNPFPGTPYGTGYTWSVPKR